jgi:leucyl aminopeptidase
MTDTLIARTETAATPIFAIEAEHLADWLTAAPEAVVRYASFCGFKAKAGQVCQVPNADGAPERVLFGLGEAGSAAAFRGLPGKLTPGDYVIDHVPAGIDPQQVATQWALGAYRYDRYKRHHGEPWPRLVVADGVDLEEARHVAHACALARDMVNTPPNDMGPLQIETIAREIAEQYGATITVVTGDDLLAENYPAVHAVGRAAAADRAPRMIEIRWTGPGAAKDGPLVALVGKGVTFDTGGLDLKPSAGMRLMKKDMGGAAHALALGRMIMARGLPIRLAVLIPAVENSVSGEAMRPGDVIDSRAGLTIEVGNTDAEGRLILADALTRASELNPDLTIDLATLTGAARAALGPQVIPFYTDDEGFAADIAAQAVTLADPLWRMPLWAGYEEALDSDIADLVNDPAGWAQAGSVTAGLFLKRFAPTGAWVHLDIFAWNPKARPGHPAGAEVQAIRALYAVICGRHG